MTSRLFAALAASAILSVAPALAAGPSSGVAPPASVVNWTGCYVGANAGFGWAPESWLYGYYAGTDYNENYGAHTTSGGVIGGQVGCDYQMGMWVVGAKADLDAADMTGSHNHDGYGQSTKLDWIATATGRAGYAIGPALLYVDGGVAWDRGAYMMALSGENYSDTITRTGFDIGLGAEYALTKNISLNLSYDYLGFGKHDVWWLYEGTEPWSFHVNQNVNLARAGLNLRF
ncbi:MAG: porin family protein [Bradyrhizobium sp.]|nr:MAG: porin family protein [Bradyrhizobium sp.]